MAGRDLSWLSRETGIASSTISDFSLGKGGKIANAMLIADALGVSVEWLIRGTDVRPIHQLIDVSDAEWLMLPRYDLRAFKPDGKPEPIDVIPIRRPWLKMLDSGATGLWLTTMPMTVPDIANEGDTVICRDADADLVDGRTYVFMRDANPLVRRVAIDASGYTLISTDAMVPPIQLGRRDPPPPDEQIVPVARILALLGIRPI
jgi:transcriptional regulator with XRE-family HTH domain